MIAHGARRAADAVYLATHPGWAGPDASDATCAEALRRGAIGLAIVSLVVGVSGYLPLSGADPVPALAFGGAGLLAAAIMLGRRQPTHLRRACARALVAMLVADGLAGWAHAAGAGTIGLLAVVVLMWSGTWLAPWGPLRVAPLAFGATVVAHLVRTPGLAEAVSSAVVTTVIGVTAAEGVARHSSALRRTKAEQTATVAALSHENVTDDLTGVGNRRWGRELLGRLRPGDCVAMVDLDHFKAINDEHGHAVGDRLLRELGTFLTDTTRGEDNVARIGGEEFVIIFPRTGASAEMAAERILAGWRARRPMTTFSMGLCVHQRSRTAEQTLSLADEALYRAKDWGRDGMVMAGRGPGAHLGRSRHRAS